MKLNNKHTLIGLSFLLTVFTASIAQARGINCELGFTTGPNVGACCTAVKWDYNFDNPKDHKWSAGRGWFERPRTGVLPLSRYHCRGNSNSNDLLKVNYSVPIFLGIRGRIDAFGIAKCRVSQMV